MQEKLILLMKKEDITQRKIADLIGISEKQIRAKLKGETNFVGDEMFIISNFFGLPIEEIFLPTIHQNGVKTKEEGI